MVNSILIFLSSLNINKKISFTCMGLWLIYLIITTSFEYGMVYPLVSAALFLVTALVINLFIKNKIANNILSVLSVLIWSILIDIVCYFIFPEYSMGVTLVNYVLRGILFNYKYIFLNASALGVYYLIKFLYKKFVTDKIVEHTK